MDGTFAGQSIQSQLNPFLWREGTYANSGYIQVSHNGQGVRLGDIPEDQLGNTQSLRLFGLGNTSTGSIGLGLYHGISNQNPFGGSPAIDDDFHMSRWLDTDFLAAADASWRLSQQFNRKTMQLSWFTGHDTDTDRMESGLFLTAQPDRLSTAYSNMETWSGRQPGLDWALGGTRRFGRVFIGIDNTLLREQNTIASETGLGLILPVSNGSLGLRLQRGVIDPQDEFGIGTQRSSLVYASYNRFFTPAFSLSLSAGASTQSQSPTQKFVAIGTQRALNQRWSLYADVTQRLDRSQRQVQVAVGCRISDEWQVRLLCGPSAIVSANGEEPQALGIQIVRSLHVRHIPTGTVAGKITLDGASYEKSVDIWLDGSLAAKAAHGQFKIAHVLPGPHTVEIAPASLSADLCPDSFTLDVDVKAGKTSAADFVIHRVGRIQGSVHVLPDAMGQTDITAAIGVTISAGGNYATTTDQNGNFVIGDVPAGQYTVTLNTGTIPDDFQVVGPTSAVVTVDPNQPAPAVPFSIRKSRTDIVFANANTPSAAPSAPSPAAKSVAPRSPHAAGGNLPRPAQHANPRPRRPASYMHPAAPAAARSAPVATRAKSAVCPPVRGGHAACTSPCPYRCCCGCQARARGHKRHSKAHRRHRHGARQSGYRSRRSPLQTARHRAHPIARRHKPFICPCPRVNTGNSPTHAGHLNDR